MIGPRRRYRIRFQRADDAIMPGTSSCVDRKHACVGKYDYIHIYVRDAQGTSFCVAEGDIFYIYMCVCAYTPGRYRVAPPELLNFCFVYRK